MKDGKDVLRGVSLSIDKLHEEVVGIGIEGMQIPTYSKNNHNCILTLTLGGHRALPDVLALERILQHLSLAGCLDKVPFRSPQLQQDKWLAQKILYNKAAELTRALEKSTITPTQAKKLATF